MSGRTGTSGRRRAGLLALVLLASTTARAADRIVEAELAEGMREIDREVRERQALDRPLYDVVAGYREKLQRARDAREAAIGHFLLAAALQRTGSRDAAVGQLQLAIGEFDDFPLAHMTLGRLYLEEGNLDRARDCFGRCRELDPERAEATVALAVTHLREGTEAGAQRVRELLEPLYARGEAPDSASWLAMAHLRLAQAAGDDAQARAALERAWSLAVDGIRAAPSNTNARAALGTVHRALDDDPAQEPRFSALVRGLGPGVASFELVASVADVFLSTGRPERAGYWLHVAIGTQPALRATDTLQVALAASVGDGGAREVLLAAARTGHARFLDARRPLALRRGDARLLRTVYLPWLGSHAGAHAEVQKTAAAVFGTLFRLLGSDDDALLGEGLSLAVETPDARALNVLAHVAEREWSRSGTSRNAVLVARALATAGERAALPSLLRALETSSPALCDEAHLQLARLTGTLDPLQPREAPADTAAHWRAWFRDARGALDLRAGLDDLAKVTRPRGEDTSWNPVLRPLTWHLLTQVLDDAQLPPEVWTAAWESVVIETGSDLRAEDRRGTPIDEDERRALAAALHARFEPVAGD